jgi:hypothetical protein
MSEVYMLMMGYPRVVKESESDPEGHPSVYGAVLAVFFDYEELKDFLRKLADVAKDILDGVPIQEAARRNNVPLEQAKRVMLLCGLYSDIIGSDLGYVVLKYSDGKYELISESSLFAGIATVPVHA